MRLKNSLKISLFLCGSSIITEIRTHNNCIHQMARSAAALTRQVNWRHW